MARLSIQRFHHAGWTTLDQGLSSLTNLGLSVAVARVATPAEFGSYALVFAFYLMVLGISRSFVSDIIGVRFSAVTDDQRRRAMEAGMAVALLLGMAATAVALVVGVLAGGSTVGLLVVMGLAMPGLLLQDLWRFAFFAGRASHWACISDGAWLAAFGCGAVLLSVLEHATPAAVLGLWCGAALLAGLVAMARDRVRPHFDYARAWWARHSRLGWTFAGEFALSSGVGQLLVLVVVAIAGLEEAGAIRAATTILGPSGVVLMAAMALAVPEGARARRHSIGLFVTRMRQVTGVVVVGVLAWGLGAWLLLPDSVGQSLLGESWARGRDVLPAATLAMVGNALATGAMAGLRVIERSGSALRLRALTAPLLVSLVALGTRAFGANGALGGQALSQAGAAPLWWRLLFRGLEDGLGTIADQRRMPSAAAE